METEGLMEIGALIESLKTESELYAYISVQNNLWKYKAFPDYFRSLKKVNSIDAASLYKKSGIERTYCYHIMDGSKRPGRDKIIRLCIAASLTVSEAQSALLSGGEALLSGNIARDIVIAYSLKKSYDLEKTAALLEETHQLPLS